MFYPRLFFSSAGFFFVFMSGAPLYDLLAQLKPGLRFHTPGHKGYLGGIFKEIANADVTELPVTDNLYCPQSVILQAEKSASSYFGSYITVFSAGGATLCIQTALSFFKGEKVIFERNSHVSVFNAAALLGIKPEFIYNRMSVIPLPVTSEQVKDSLEKNPDAEAVFITSPNYYGLCADLSEIKKICEKYSVRLVIDNSHGTHLYEIDRISSPQRNSDICIDSAHKTLPVLTGGAFLHINFVTDLNFVKNSMSVFGSTSPSFPVLASLDYAREWLAHGGGESIRRTGESVSDLKRCIPFEIVESEPLRITVIDANAGKLAERMLENGIIYEMATPVSVVLLFSPFNTDFDFKTVKKFFMNIDIKPKRPDSVFSFPETKRKVAYLDALFSDYEIVDSEQAVGRIAARNVLPYPPGVPVLLAGEEILSLTGLKGKICVLKKNL